MSNVTCKLWHMGSDTGCLLASDWSKIVPLCDVFAAIGPCISSKMYFAKNQLSTNQNLFNARAVSRNDNWTCIIPLDLYRLA